MRKFSHPQQTFSVEFSCRDSQPFDRVKIDIKPLINFIYYKVSSINLPSHSQILSVSTSTMR